MADLDPERELTLSFFPDNPGWVVRLDEFSMAGAGSTKEEAVQKLAESMKIYLDRGVLDHAKPVGGWQVTKERLGAPTKETETIRLKDLLRRVPEN